MLKSVTFGFSPAFTIVLRRATLSSQRPAFAQVLMAVMNRAWLGGMPADDELLKSQTACCQLLDLWHALITTRRRR